MSLPPAPAALSPPGRLLREAAPTELWSDGLGRQRGQGGQILSADQKSHRARETWAGPGQSGTAVWEGEGTHRSTLVSIYHPSTLLGTPRALTRSCPRSGALRTGGNRPSQCSPLTSERRHYTVPLSLPLGLLCSYTFAWNVPEQPPLPRSPCGRLIGREAVISLPLRLINCLCGCPRSLRSCPSVASRTR